MIEWENAICDHGKPRPDHAVPARGQRVREHSGHRDLAHVSGEGPWIPTVRGAPLLVLVIDCVLIMPHPCDWVCHLVTNERPAIRSRLGFDVLMVAPVQALMAGVVRTVAPTAEKVKLVTPATLRRR